MVVVFKRWARLEKEKQDAVTVVVRGGRDQI
jgi:hypothetical protein